MDDQTIQATRPGCVWKYVYLFTQIMAIFYGEYHYLAMDLRPFCLTKPLN